MNAIVTGMNGTVAPVLAARLAAEGVQVTAWDRHQVPTDDPAALRAFLDAARPDWFFHVATGPVEWAVAVAEGCRERAIRLLFTSTVSVFSDQTEGPITPDRPPDATDDYGRYKIACEQGIRAAHPGALIARLGWQIGEQPGGNHMVTFLARTMEREGHVGASTRWLPACAFLEDTADALVRLATEADAGLYHLEGNPGLSFFEIATRLNRAHGHPWQLVATEHPARDGRMQDERVTVRPITARL